MKTALGYHRLTIDLEPENYNRLKKLAVQNERTASKQAKIILLEILSKLELTTKRTKPK